ncbi:MAG: hypothetical protein WBB82_00150 [Limnothrix sp.]
MEVVSRSLSCSATVDDLATYADKGKRYVKSAIDSAILLGLIEELSENTYYVSKDCSSFLTENPSDELESIAFRKFLQEWQPFTIFFGYLHDGDSVEKAAKKLTSFYDFNKDASFIAKLLSNWSKSCGILDAKNKLLVEKHFPEYTLVTEETVNNIQNDASLRIYLSDFFGDELFSWLNSLEIQELINAFACYKKNPRDSISASGRAYEDVLRRLALEHPVVDSKKVAKKNGITQLTEGILSPYRDDEGKQHYLIHAKQTPISKALGSIRNMAGHGMDPKTLENWDISIEGALSSISLTVVSIKSLYFYVKNTRQVF